MVVCGFVVGHLFLNLYTSIMTSFDFGLPLAWVLDSFLLLPLTWDLMVETITCLH